MYNRMSANAPLFPIPSGQLITLIGCKGCGIKIPYQDVKLEKTYCPKSGCPLPYEFSYKCSRCGAIDNGEFILKERAPGVSVQEIKDKTAGNLTIVGDVPEMTFS